MFDFLMTSAWAEAAPASAPSPYASFIMLGGMLIVFYFLMWRPQSKRAKEHKHLMASLSKGDEIIINGGLMGRIVKVDDLYATIEISDKDKVEVKVQKTAIASSLPKGTLKAI